MNNRDTAGFKPGALRTLSMQEDEWSASYILASDGERVQRKLTEASTGELTVVVAMTEEVARLARRRLGYLGYLESDAWAEKRSRVLAAADGCAVCTSPTGLDVHHRTYERFGEENDADLIALCRLCHDVFHKYRRVAR